MDLIWRMGFVGILYRILSAAADDLGDSSDA